MLDDPVIRKVFINHCSHAMLFIILDEQNSGTRYYQESMDPSKI